MQCIEWIRSSFIITVIMSVIVNNLQMKFVDSIEVIIKIVPQISVGIAIEIIFYTKT